LNHICAALLITLNLLFCYTASADTLANIRDTGVFIWGADQEGGGPYVFPDPKDDSVLSGFEVDLANLIAGELSKQLNRPVKAQFAQSPWDMLPSLLNTHRVDVVLNGYEATPERAQVMLPTRPYYIFTLQLLARADFTGKPQRIGVLGGSAAERYVREQFPNGEVEIILYDGNTNAMLDVSRGKIDATVQDTPIALFYKPDFPDLRFVGEPVSKGQYVMYVRNEDTTFQSALNLAISRLYQSGALKKCYDKYGIWTPEQTQLQATETEKTTPQPQSDESFFSRHGQILLEAAGMTLLLSFGAMPLAILLGIFIALGRLYGPRWFKFMLRWYIEIIRGTPLLLQLLFIFYLLPTIGINLHPIAAALLGLALNYSAYEAEIYRAGLLAIPVGQMEAALTLGMSRPMALRRIMIPQAMRIVLPPVTNDFIALFKDTSVCSVVTVVELAKRYNIAVMSHPADLVPLAAITALLYLFMSFPLSVLSRRLESEAQQ